MEYNLKSLVKLEKDRINEAAEVFSRAFVDDPLVKWFFPEDSSRIEMSFSYFRFRIMYGVLYGEVYATSQDLEGIAVWIPPKNVKITNFKMLRSGGFRLMKDLGFELIGKLMSIGNFVSNIHQRLLNVPHWHLSPMGVAPEYQSQGFGSKLMRSMLKRLDEEKLPCFLETQNKNNAEIYRHYGYKIIDFTTIPNTDLQHWSMLRNPPD
ncbi:MAG: GNAT family N-acetyltransferase [Asgard group archaeon]|nr:GNAT family N-acetyltransferase [Asgard group archaeon]